MNRSSACYQAIRRNLQRPWATSGRLRLRSRSQDLRQTHLVLSSLDLRLQYFGTKNGSHGKGKSSRVKKESFAKRFLEPAARGELVKHQSGIPKLAARKTKGHALKDAFPGKEADDMLEKSLEFETTSSAPYEEEITIQSTRGSNNAQKKPGGKKHEELVALFEGYTKEDLNPDLKKSYKFIGDKMETQRAKFQRNRNLKKRDNNIMGELAHDDSWETYIMEFEYTTPHPESLREAKRIVYPTNRVNPSDEFLSNGFKSFAYVTNVPRPVVDGTLANYDTPMHRYAVAELVADVFSVPVEQVFPASVTSAFVGFRSAMDAAEKYIESATKRIIVGDKIVASLYSTDDGDASDEEKEFVADSAIIKIENIPAGFKPGTLARRLYGTVNLDVKDILFTSHSVALIRLPTEEEATKLVESGIVENALGSIHRQILRVFPAKFELVHHKYAGVLRKTQLKKPTKNLIVSGDVPSDKFLMCHGSVLHLCNVPISATKKMISDAFQKFCVQKRDIEGSIEIVKSIDGYPNGRVYVGFDLASEAEAAWKEISANSQRIRLSEAGPPIHVRPVKEKAMIRGQKLGARSERSQEELIASLNEWKTWIDPKDMEELESYGVTMDVLEEAFTAARLHNPTFGVEDQARVGERLRPEMKPGQHFQEFVKMYIDTLKELGATKDNPGLKYEGMFLPDEEIDYDLFDMEDERLAALQEEFESYRVEETDEAKQS